MICANRFDNNSLTHDNQPYTGQGMLVVIDPAVGNYQMLAAGVRADADLLILERNRDAIEQITMALARHREHQSLHIICHGAPGKLYLGQTSLSAENLAPYRQQLLEWGVAEILLYSCEVAAGEVGTAFVEQLSRATGADIAASAHLVGNATLGGTWHLESKSGEVSAGLAFVPEVLQDYPGVFTIKFSTYLTYNVYEDGVYSGDPITIERTDDTDLVTVDVVFGTPYDTATGGASFVNGTPGVDYINTTQTVTFEPTMKSVVVDLEINEDTDDTEPTEAFGITLRNATGSEPIDPIDFSNVNILNGSSGGIPEIPDLENFNLVGFTLANYQVNEDGTPVGVEVTIERAGLTNLASSVDVKLIDGSATGGSDFDNTGFPLTIDFASGDTTKIVTVPIMEDTDNEGTENFTLELFGGSSGTVLGLQYTATVEILDNDTGSTPGGSLIDGTSDNDSLNGSIDNDTINGLEGDDTLDGDKGDDSLNGGDGDDILDGKGGKDILNGDDGDDILDGKGGKDILNGGNGQDTLDGQGGNDTLNGGNGRDQLRGHKGKDVLNGGNDNDKLYGEQDNDLLIGGKGKDKLFGGSGNDELSGDNGDDTLTGTDKNPKGVNEIDTLTGGHGYDWFVLGHASTYYYNDGDDSDTGLGDYAVITDFDPTKDTIQLHGVAADYMLSTSPLGTPGGTGIFLKTTSGSGVDELIGIVIGSASDVEIANAFHFVP